MEAPIAVSVVVASHARHLRLRWLLNALEEQTLERELWEVVVVHDYDPATAERVIQRHPLSESRTLRAIAIPAGSGSPARQRNLGWRAAAGDLIAFTDDDCRPDPEWLERLLAAAQKAPGDIVQGSTRPDPLERAVLAAPHVRTMWVDPVSSYAQTCNILYPRELLESLGGFDERAIAAAGEDVALALRARAAGVRISPASDAIVNHAVESYSLPGIVRQNLKWHHLAYLVKVHPEMRRELPLRIFWDVHHLRTTAAMVGIVGARRHQVLLALAVPYALHASRRRGRKPRRRAIAVAEIPGQALRQAAEVFVLAAGSVRYRTFLL